MTATDWALIGAAPIATALVIFGIVVVRGTKVSEFRQAWIDAQRNDLGTMLAHAGRLARGNSSHRDDDWLAFDMAVARIELRKNPNTKKQEWDDVLAEITSLRVDLDISPVVPVSINSRVTEVVRLSRPWLKKEWSRVRFGEIGYKTLVLFAALLILFPILPIVGFALANAIGLGAYLPQGLTADALIPHPK